MPKTKEFTIRMEDRPGTLGRYCQALADRNVNIVAFASCPGAGESSVHLVTDNPNMCKSVLDDQKLKYTENEVVQVELPNRPGSLARAASQLGTANVNINYVYSGVDPGSNKPLVVFSVSDMAKAMDILEKVSKAA